MNNEIYKVLDTSNGEEYFCDSKEAVRAVIADITGFNKNSQDVIDAAEGGYGFDISTIHVYNKRGF